MLQAASSSVNPITRMALRTPLNARERALLRAKQQHIQVAKINRNRWVATSASDPDRLYSLFVDEDGRVLCDCPGARKGFTCKHSAKVEAEIEADKECQQLVKRETLSQQAKRLGVSELEALYL